MKHCDLLTALGLTLGHGGTPHGTALKADHSRHSKIALTEIN